MRGFVRRDTWPAWGARQGCGARPSRGRRLRAIGPWAGIALSFGIMLVPADATGQVRSSEYYARTQVRPTSALERGDRGWMGVSINITVTTDGAGAEQTIVRVLRTVEGSPAARAGMLPGDVIVRIDDEPLTFQNWERLTGDMAIGDQVVFDVRGEDDRSRSVVLVAGPRPEFTLPSGVSDRLEAVRESFEARLESGRGVWATRDHVRFLISGDSIEEASNRILDQARRNAVAFKTGPRWREPSPAPRVSVPPAIGAPGEVSVTLGPGRFLWSFGGDSVQGWSSSEPMLVAPNVEAGGRYSVILSAESALPFEYLLLSSQEADSLKTAVIRLRTELSTLHEATQTREMEIVEIITRRARELDENDVRLNRLRSDNNRVSEELSQVAARLAEVGSVERREREERRRIEVMEPTPVVPVRSMTAGLVGRNFVGGAQFSDLNPRLSEYFGADRGVLVIDVLRGTPAFKAGLVPGDVVFRVANTDVESLVAFRAALKEAYARERSAILSIIRKAQPLRVTLSR